jgi:hypothetical protein
MKEIEMRFNIDQIIKAIKDSKPYTHVNAYDGDSESGPFNVEHQAWKIGQLRILFQCKGTGIMGAYIHVQRVKRVPDHVCGGYMYEYQSISKQHPRWDELLYTLNSVEPIPHVEAYASKVAP